MCGTRRDPGILTLYCLELVHHHDPCPSIAPPPVIVTEQALGNQYLIRSQRIDTRIPFVSLYAPTSGANRVQCPERDNWYDGKCGSCTHCETLGVAGPRSVPATASTCRMQESKRRKEANGVGGCDSEKRARVKDSCALEYRNKWTEPRPGSMSD